MAKRVLLTGGTGFVGANLARSLLAQGHALHLLARPSYNPWRITGLSEQINLHIVDFEDREALQAAVARIRPDWVFHTAAYGAYSSQTDTQRIIRTNYAATVNLVEVCLKAGFEAFIYTGSSSEYGIKDHAPIEREWIDPNSDYAVAKAAATQYCRYAAIRYKAPITSLRLYSVYGPYEEPSRLIPTLIERGLAGQWPPLANPNIARDYVYVDDVVEACLAAALTSGVQPGAVYNVGTGQQTTLAEVVDVARREMQIRIPPAWGSMPDRIWDSPVWVANIDAIQAALGWQPRHRFADGLHSTAAWLVEEPGRLQYYRQNRLPPG
jgi:UDP-glucose 4-epimerase